MQGTTKKGRKEVKVESVIEGNLRALSVQARQRPAVCGAAVRSINVV